MQYHYLFALASLGFVSALPQESGGQQPGGDASGMNMNMSGGMAMGQGQGGDQGDAAPGQPGGVPMDLAGGFKPDQISLQMSYTGDASEGIKSGAKVSQQDAMKEPKFALGDSSGVNTQAKWVIIIVDTTSKDQRMLHYVKSDYMATGQKTEIASQKEPKMAYMGPGMLGEQGQGRQYTALMYTQKGDFPGMGMPQQGQPVVMQDWVKANGLDKAIAGTNFQADVQSMGGMAGGMGNQMNAQGGSMTMSGNMPMASGESMPGMAGGDTSGQAGGMMQGGGQAGGAPAPAGAAPTGPAAGVAGGAGSASASGAMPSGLMSNGSMPTVASPTPSAPPASTSSKPATGAAASNSWSAALGLGAVGAFAVALF